MAKSGLTETTTNTENPLFSPKPLIRNEKLIRILRWLAETVIFNLSGH